MGKIKPLFPVLILFSGLCPQEMPEGRAGAHLVVVDQFAVHQRGIWNAYPMEPRRVNRERSGVLLYGK